MSLRVQSVVHPETGSAIIGAGCAAAGSARQRSGLIEEDALVKMVQQQSSRPRFAYFPVQRLV
jgi:hypothetical protein